MSKCRNCEPVIGKKKLVEIHVKKQIARVVAAKTTLTINQILELVQIKFTGSEGAKLAQWIIDNQLKRKPEPLSDNLRGKLIQYLEQLADRHNKDWTVVGLLRKLERGN